MVVALALLAGVEVATVEFSTERYDFIISRQRTREADKLKWRRITFLQSHERRIFFDAERNHHRCRARRERGGLAGRRTRLLGGIVGDAASKRDPCPPHGALRRARVLELPRKPRSGDGLWAAQGGAAASWVGNPTPRRSQPGPGGRCPRGRPRGLPKRRHRDDPRPPEYRGDP